jgi:hypothetical protein
VGDPHLTTEETVPKEHYSSRLGFTVSTREFKEGVCLQANFQHPFNGVGLGYAPDFEGPYLGDFLALYCGGVVFGVLFGDTLFGLFAREREGRVR